MKHLLFCLLFSSSLLHSQEKKTLDSLSQKNEKEVLTEIEAAHNPTSVKSQALNPTKAGLYSAALPGLGQYYNKKYWKIPLALGAIGTGVGIAIWNDHQYKRYRNAFVSELNGEPHEFSGINGVNANVLGRTQDAAKRQRDYAIAVSAVIYLLNILDAVVDAHLHEGRKDPDLAFSPVLIQNQYPLGLHDSSLGIRLGYRF